MHALEDALHGLVARAGDLVDQGAVELESVLRRIVNDLSGPDEVFAAWMSEHLL